VRRVCEGGDLELPMNGVDTLVAQIGTWETVKQMAVPLQLCTKTRAAKCLEIFV